MEATHHVDAWLDAVVDDRRSIEEVAGHLADDARFLEHPNLVNPGGSDRDRAAMVAGIEAGRGLLAWQRFDDRRHDPLGEDRVLTRATWRWTRARSPPGRS